MTYPVALASQIVHNTPRDQWPELYRLAAFEHRRLADALTFVLDMEQQSVPGCAEPAFFVQDASPA